MASTFATHILALANHAATLPTPCTAPRRPRTNTYATAVLLMAVGGNAATAATDGAVATNGASSSGQIGISLVIPERINAQDLGDINLAADNRGTLRGGTSACVAGRGSGNYHMVASSSASGPLTGYQLEYSANGNQFRALTMGQALEHLTGAGAKGCETGSAAGRLALRMAADAPQQRTAPGTRTVQNALTLMLAPE